MKVLIVDDEINNVQMIQQEIDWEALHIDEVKSAEDGEEAKEILADFDADILLCDVEMPRVNGLELIQWINESKKDMEIVILSCHDNFAYAQTAMRYGVREYLVKPFRMEELYITLSKAVFAAEQKEESKLGKKSESLYWEQGVLQRLYNQEVVNERMLQDLLESRNGSLSTEGRYRMLYLGINRSDITNFGYTKQQFDFIFENITSEILGLEVSGTCAIRSRRDPFYFLIYFLEYDEAFLQDKCEDILQIGEQYLKLPIYICISEEDDLLHVVKHREAVEEYYLNHLKIGNSSMIFMGQDLEKTGDNEIGIDEATLLNALRQERYAEFTRYVRECMIFLEKEGKLNLTMMERIERLVSHSMYRLCDERDLSTSAVFTEETVHTLQKEASFGIPSMLKYITYTIACIQNELKIVKDSGGIVEEAKQYIAKHYMEDIGRNDIANECHVSPGYLSKVFSESVGMNMREYINQYRVNESKRLLRDPDKSIGYVAMEVGFENLSYFSTIFKKVCGETPVEWRKRFF